MAGGTTPFGVRRLVGTRGGIVPDGLRHVLGFARHEAGALRAVARRRWARYAILRAIPSARFVVDSRAILVRDAVSTIEIGYQATVGPYVYLCALDGGRLALGAGVSLTEFDNVRAAGGDVVIGDRTIVAQYVSIIGSNHRIPPRDELIVEAGIEQGRRGVRIGRDVWIAANVVILPGVEIGDGAVIGAGSIVSKSIPPYAVAAGNPARVFRYRDDPAAGHGAIG